MAGTIRALPSVSVLPPCPPKSRSSLALLLRRPTDRTDEMVIIPLCSRAVSAAAASRFSFSPTLAFGRRRPLPLPRSLSRDPRRRRRLGMAKMSPQLLHVIWKPAEPRTEDRGRPGGRADGTPTACINEMRYRSSPLNVRD